MGARTLTHPRSTAGWSSDNSITFAISRFNIATRTRPFLQSDSDAPLGVISSRPMIWRLVVVGRQRVSPRPVRRSAPNSNDELMSILRAFKSLHMTANQTAATGWSCLGEKISGRLIQSSAATKSSCRILVLGNGWLQIRRVVSEGDEDRSGRTARRLSRFAPRQRGPLIMSHRLEHVRRRYCRLEPCRVRLDKPIRRPSAPLRRPPVLGEQPVWVQV